MSIKEGYKKIKTTQHMTVSFFLKNEKTKITDGDLKNLESDLEDLLNEIIVCDDLIEIIKKGDIDYNRDLNLIYADYLLKLEVSINYTYDCGRYCEPYENSYPASFEINSIQGEASIAKNCKDYIKAKMKDSTLNKIMKLDSLEIEMKPLKEIKL